MLSSQNRLICWRTSLIHLVSWPILRRPSSLPPSKRYNEVRKQFVKADKFALLTLRYNESIDWFSGSWFISEDSRSSDIPNRAEVTLAGKPVAVLLHCVNTWSLDFLQGEYYEKYAVKACFFVRLLCSDSIILKFAKLHCCDIAKRWPFCNPGYQLIVVWRALLQTFQEHFELNFEPEKNIVCEEWRLCFRSFWDHPPVSPLDSGGWGGRSRVGISDQTLTNQGLILIKMIGKVMRAEGRDITEAASIVFFTTAR